MLQRQGTNRRQQYLISAIKTTLLVLALAISAFCQNTGPHTDEKAANVWAQLQNAKGTVRASLVMENCAGYTDTPCVEYLIEALQYRLEGLTAAEIKITDVERRRVIFVDRSLNAFLYMLPLAPGSVSNSAGLLATVWGSGDSIGGVKVYLLSGDNVRVVLYNGSRFSPQFIQATEGMSNPVVIMDRGYTMRGGTANPVGPFPKDSEIWQWNPATEKFELSETVPVDEKFSALAKLEKEGTTK